MSDGKPIPDTEARRSLNGFVGMLLVTPDADWRGKWDTPASNIPKFNKATSVPRGKQVFILTFFANPKLDADGRANLKCDLDITRPDGSATMHQTDLTCFAGVSTGNPYHMRLSAPVVGFTGDPGDPAGTWTVRVALKDKVANTVLPLTTSFVLE